MVPDLIKVGVPVFFPALHTIISLKTIVQVEIEIVQAKCIVVFIACRKRYDMFHVTALQREERKNARTSRHEVVRVVESYK